MVERTADDTLTSVLKAASDPTRRAILTLLAQEGPQRIGAIAARFDLSLNAISKHVKVLEAAGLVSRRTQWREHYIALDPAPLDRVDDWFATLRSVWDQRLEALDQLVGKDPDR